MVKPGGTGRPIEAISARFAPLPPSRFLVARLAVRSAAAEAIDKRVMRAAFGRKFHKFQLPWAKTVSPRSSRNRRRGGPASRIRASRSRRASRLAGSGSFTVTLSKNASTGARRRPAPPSPAHNPPRRARPRPCGSAASSASSSSVSSILGRVGKRFRSLPRSRGPLLLLQDVGGALVAGEQVGALRRSRRRPAAPSPGRAGGRDRPRSPPPSAKTASIRSWRTPASRCWTFSRSPRKSSNRLGEVGRLLDDLAALDIGGQRRLPADDDMIAVAIGEGRRPRR